MNWIYLILLVFNLPYMAKRDVNVKAGKKVTPAGAFIISGISLRHTQECPRKRASESQR
jgi:hypothetical protein